MPAGNAEQESDQSLRADPVARAVGFALLAAGFVAGALPTRGEWWLVGTLLVAASAAVLSTRGVAVSSPPRIVVLALALPVAALLTGLRWEPDAMARAGCLIAGGALSLAVSGSPRRLRRVLAWSLAVAALLALVSIWMLSLAAVRVGSVFYHEVWTGADVGLLSPFRWSELAGPLGALALPLTIGLARSTSSRGRRRVALALAWLLAVALALGGHFTSWIAALVGILWAAAHLSRRGRVVALSAAAVAVVGCGVLAVVISTGPTSPNGKLRVVSRGLAHSLNEWVEPAAYAWRTDLAVIGSAPWLGHGLLGFPAAYAEAREERWIPVAGVERPSTARCDPLLLAGECGIPSALITVGAFVLVLLRSRRRDACLSGALAAGLISTVLGHAYAPVNAWCLWLLLGLAARGDEDAPVAEVRRTFGSFVAAGAACCAALGLGLMLTPSQPERTTRADLLEVAAREPGADSAGLLRRAAMMHSLRWEALATSATTTPEEREAERLAYAHFCGTYSAELRADGDASAARAYDALREELLHSRAR